MLHGNHSLIIWVGRSRFSVCSIHEDLHEADMLWITMGESLGKHRFFIFSVECCGEVVETQCSTVTFFYCCNCHNQQ